MKLKICICYDLNNISKGEVFNTLDYYVLNGMTHHSKSFGRSKANSISNGALVYGMYVYEEIDTHETSLPFIIFSDKVKEPVYKSKNQVISPIDYCWHLIVDTKVNNPYILSGKYCYDLSKKVKNIKKEKITQDIESSLRASDQQKDSKKGSEHILNPVEELKKKIKTTIFDKK